MPNRIILFDSGRERFLRMLIEGGFYPLDGHVLLGLFQNNPVFNAHTTLGDLVECSFVGYSPVLLEGAMYAGLDLAGNSTWQWPAALFACLATPIIPVLAMGYFVVSADDGCLLWGQLFDYPAAFVQAGDNIYFEPQLSLGDLCDGTVPPAFELLALDSLLANQVEKTLGLDSFVVSRLIQSFAIQSVLKGTAPVPMAIDSLIANQNDIAMSLDALVADQNSQTIGADSLLANLSSVSLGADSLLANLGSFSLGADSLLANLGSKTLGADSLLANLVSKTLGADSLLANLSSKTLGADSLLANLVSKTLGADSLLAAQNNKTLGIDSDIAALLLWDQFVATDGTLLSAHTPEVGPGWTVSVYASLGSASDLVINSNTVQNVNNATSSVVIGSMNAGQASCTCRIQFQVTNANNHTVGMVTRFTNANNQWKCLIANKVFQLIRQVGGSGTTVQSATITGLLANTTYLMTCTMSGNNIDCRLEGPGITTTNLPTQVDATYNTVTNHGVWFQRLTTTLPLCKISSFQCFK